MLRPTELEIRRHTTPSRGCWIITIVSVVFVISAATALSVFFGLKCDGRDTVMNVTPSAAEVPLLNDERSDHQMLTDVRLPRNLLPVHYTVRLLPWMYEGNFTTDGQVRIELRCVEATAKIVLHNADNRIHHESVKVISSFSQSIQL